MRRSRTVRHPVERPVPEVVVRARGWFPWMVRKGERIRIPAGQGSLFTFQGQRVSNFKDEDLYVKAGNDRSDCAVRQGEG